MYVNVFIDLGMSMYVEFDKIVYVCVFVNSVRNVCVHLNVDMNLVCMCLSFWI